MVPGRWFGMLACVLVLACLSAGGCGKNTSAPSDNGGAQVPNLEDPTGGFTNQNEQAAFGDAALSASAASEAATTDPVETTDPKVAEWASAPDSVHLYCVTLLWGILRRDPVVRSALADSGSAAATDWSGHAAVNRGALVVRSTIAFEALDHLVLPRTDRTRIDWVAHTTTSFDGIRFWILQPFDSTNTGSSDSLTVVAGAHSWSFRVDDLAAADTTYAVDDAGNKFSIQSFRMGPGTCVHGFMGGVWLTPATAGASGVLRGRWVGERGETAGYLKGIFGTNRRGAGVFFAKYIDRNGVFRGFLVGTYGTTGAEEGAASLGAAGNLGSFQGRILNAGRSPIGACKGHWHARADGTDGMFDGIWSVGCTP